MRTSQRVKQIELILRDDSRSYYYWASPDLQRELRELLAILHGCEHEEQDGGEPLAIEANDASPVVLASK